MSTYLLTIHIHLFIHLTILNRPSTIGLSSVCLSVYILIYLAICLVQSICWPIEGKVGILPGAVHTPREGLKSVVENEELT